MRPQRAADLVAADIRHRILRREFEDGLPKEADLLEEYSVSRPTLREVLRILEAEGLIQTRRGKRGGSGVRLPTPESAAYHLGLTLQSTGADMASLAQARLHLESLCASLAARRPDREAIARALNELSDEAEPLVGKGAEFTACSLKFHAALVQAAGSSTIEILVGTIEAIWVGQEQRWAEAAAELGSYPDETDQASSLASHRQIATRIERGDADGAMKAARSHLEASMKFVADTTAPNGKRNRRRGKQSPVVDASILRL